MASRYDPEGGQRLGRLGYTRGVYVCSRADGRVGRICSQGGFGKRDCVGAGPNMGVYVGRAGR